MVHLHGLNQTSDQTYTDIPISDNEDAKINRLNRAFAREFGIIDEYENYTDISYTREDIEVGESIEELFTRVRNKKKGIIEKKK